MQTSIPIACEIVKPSKNEIIPRPDLSDDQFVDYIEKKVQQTIIEQNLFTKQDKVLVAASGGKDSTVLVYVLKKLGYDIEAVTVDAHIGCYTEENLNNLRKVCKSYGVNLHEISFKKEFGGSLCNIRDKINSNGANLKSCSVCGVFRRYLINKKAREIQPGYVAFGHNLDDEAQAFFMNVIKNNLQISARMGPTTGQSSQKTMVPRVKPLYFILEDEIIRYVKILRFPVHVGKCPCSIGGQRNFIKDMLNEAQQKIPDVKQNMLSYFLEHKEALKDQYSHKSAGMCNYCGEPSSRECCRTCQMLEMI